VRRLAEAEAAEAAEAARRKADASRASAEAEAARRQAEAEAARAAAKKPPKNPGPDIPDLTEFYKNANTKLRVKIIDQIIVDTLQREVPKDYSDDNIIRIEHALNAMDLTRNNGYKFFEFYDQGDTREIWRKWYNDKKNFIDGHHPGIKGIINKELPGTLRGGAYTESVRGPDELPDILEEQDAWNKANDAYNNLEPEYKTLLPPPSESLGPAPLSSLATPFQNYINNEADPEALEEARDALGMIPPEEVEDYINNDEFENEMNGNAVSQRVTPMYQSALPGVKPEWVTIMIRADILQQLLQNKMATVDGIRQI
jgi:hypothetical protein